MSLDHSAAAVAAPAATPLTDAEYAARTRAVLDRIEAQVDQWLDADVIDIDSHRSGGLLELSFPDRSKIIINTQAPLQELWLAAKAGGYHFRFVAGAWLDTKTSSEFHAHLSSLASAQAGKALSFSALE
ncbi:iron donor protein CyaY [Paucibacter sp. KCTC 42545]|uniref:iron donor protein CyaY n=1 Tax=Paucibacter sp. KCTC 42545 TaxID=1768242 RepID=UPI000733A4CE|nr:iron donor protein CyaY [Paucibacter sp. KCTC 42545]ALT78299.1 iron donor protein CyaY [Paucibacter sp. KCTC 42545]